MLKYYGAIFILFVAILIRKFFFKRKPKLSLLRRHVLVTGGSSGIGKELAILATKMGADVTIIARNPHRLEEVAEHLRERTTYEDQVITPISVDVADFRSMKSKINELEEAIGPVYMLANCAGFAQCGRVEDFSEEDTRRLIRTNYMGTLFPIQVLLPKFKQRREGIIVLTGSQASLVGIFGYSVYSSCKFAVRGLAESLRMETKPYNISVTLALPPDTDTPGFAIENRSKPLETFLISRKGGLYQPEDVAARIMRDSLRKKFFSTIGFESYFLTTLCVGMTPINSLRELLLQTLILGPLRVLSVLYLRCFTKTIFLCHQRKLKHKLKH